MRRILRIACVPHPGRLQRHCPQPIRPRHSPPAPPILHPLTPPSCCSPPSPATGRTQPPCWCQPGREALPACTSPDTCTGRVHMICICFVNLQTPAPAAPERGDQLSGRKVLAHCQLGARPSQPLLLLGPARAATVQPGLPPCSQRSAWHVWRSQLTTVWRPDRKLPTWAAARAPRRSPPAPCPPCALHQSHQRGRLRCQRGGASSSLVLTGENACCWSFWGSWPAAHAMRVRSEVRQLQTWVVSGARFV